MSDITFEPKFDGAVTSELEVVDEVRQVLLKRNATPFDGILVAGSVLTSLLTSTKDPETRAQMIAMIVSGAISTATNKNPHDPTDLEANSRLNDQLVAFFTDLVS